MSLDVLRFTAAELRGHVALALPVSRSCAAASACAAAGDGRCWWLSNETDVAANMPTREG